MLNQCFRFVWGLWSLVGAPLSGASWLSWDPAACAVDPDLIDTHRHLKVLLDGLGGWKCNPLSCFTVRFGNKVIGWLGNYMLWG